MRVNTAQDECLVCDAAFGHEDMKASRGDDDALHRYPLSCSVLYYLTERSGIIAYAFTM